MQSLRFFVSILQNAPKDVSIPQFTDCSLVSTLFWGLIFEKHKKYLEIWNLFLNFAFEIALFLLLSCLLGWIGGSA